MKTIFTFLLFACGILQAQAQIQWQRCYGGSFNDYCSKIEPTYDGGYILAGSAESIDGDVGGNHGRFDFWIVKIAVNGDMEWQKSYGGSNADYAVDICQTTDSGYVIAGGTYSIDGDVTGNHGGFDVWVIKISPTGALLWQKCFGGSGDDEAKTIIQTNDRGYIFAGRTTSSDGDVIGSKGGDDFWVVKLSTTGSINWAKCYGGTANDAAGSVQQTFDGGYAVGGVSRSVNGDVTHHRGDSTNQNIWLVKLAENGNFEWDKSLGDSCSYGGQRGDVAIQTSDSGYLITGSTACGGGDVTEPWVDYRGEAWVAKLNVNGVKQWDVCGIAGGHSSVSTAKQSVDGGFLLGGCQPDHIYRSPPLFPKFDYAVFGKLKNTGEKEWSHYYGSPVGNAAFFSLVATADSSGIAAGKASANGGDVSGNHGGDDYWVVKFSLPSIVSKVEQTQKITTTISPNPVSNLLNITASGIVTHLTIANTVGQQVFSGKYNKEDVTIDVSALPSGMYFIRINDGETKRFLKE